MNRPISGRIVTLTVLLCLAWVSSACSVRREGPAQGTKAGAKLQGIYDTPMDMVVVLDEDLAKWTGRNYTSGSKIAVQKHGARRTDSSALEVVAEIRNRTDKDIAVELRTTYYDEQQFPLEEPSKWRPVNLPAQATSNYRETSLSTRAQHYLVEVRRAHRK